jgi:hypothetical protein
LSWRILLCEELLRLMLLHLDSHFAVHHLQRLDRR